MSLIEALIAVVVLSGLVATAIDSYRTAQLRAHVSGMEVRAATMAENLLARVGEDIPLEASEAMRMNDGALTWRTNGQVLGTVGKLQMFSVQSHVKLVSSGVTVEQTLSTIKLRQVRQK